MTRHEFLADALDALLSRLSPPLSIKASKPAQMAETAAMLKAINRLAPTTGYGDWWPAFEDALMRKAKTRAWPIISEIEAAAQMPGRQAASDDAVEAAAVQRMTEWFAKFRDQMPSHGKPSRTAALIRQGVLANEAEARFRGFDLSDDQLKRAKTQRDCADDRATHERVLDSLAALRAEREPIMDGMPKGGRA